MGLSEPGGSFRDPTNVDKTLSFWFFVGNKGILCWYYVGMKSLYSLLRVVSYGLGLGLGFGLSTSGSGGQSWAGLWPVLCKPFFWPQSLPWIQRQTLNLKTLDPEKTSKPMPEPPQTSWVVLVAGVRGGLGFGV